MTAYQAEKRLDMTADTMDIGEEAKAIQAELTQNAQAAATVLAQKAQEILADAEVEFEDCGLEPPHWINHVIYLIEKGIEF